MVDFFSIAAALFVISMGIAFFAAMALRRTRAIQGSGFVEVSAPDNAINRLTKSLLGETPSEVYHREHAGEQSWLVFADAGSSEGSGSAMLFYRTGHNDWPAVVLVQSGHQIPKMFRQLTGGLFNWAKPIADTEIDSLAGTGWFAYKEPQQDIPPALMERIGRAARTPASQRLLGIAVRDAYLMIWSDAGRVQTLFAVAPLVRAAMLDEIGHSKA